jgi:large subunit ribosomal protein L11
LAKKVAAIIKLQIPAGKANPAPPIGPALGQHGVNIMGFCNEYNQKTQGMEGSIVPVEITVYADRSFSFICKTPPTTDLIKKACGIDKANSKPGHDEPIILTKAALREIAEKKAADANANDVEAAERAVIGTARSMGIKVEE